MPYVWIALGFSAVIFVHELGHFAVAKWAGVRVDRFAIGFGSELFGFTKGETRYSFNILPLGGYVKMLGQEDFEVDKTGEIEVKNDPRSFTNKPVGARMAIVSAGVIMNVIFAAFLFMIIFMVGKEDLSPIIGSIDPDMPAAQAGLTEGDRITSINGQSIASFQNLNMEIMLAQPHRPTKIGFERNGEQMSVDVVPEISDNSGLMTIGITAAISPEVQADSLPLSEDEEPQYKQGDILIAANGVDITEENINDRLIKISAETQTEPIHLRFKRPANPEQGTPEIEYETTLERQVGVSSPELGGERNEKSSVLGFRPLCDIYEVDEGARADLAGLKKGDLILKWGDVEFPTSPEVVEQTEANPNKDLIYHVYRHESDEVIKGEVRPKAKWKVLGRGPARVGIAYSPKFQGPVRLGRSLKEFDGEKTPAAAANIPPNSVIEAVDGQPAPNWPEFIEILGKKAGSEVTLSYVTDGGERLETRLSVPQSPRSKLGLTHFGQSWILAVNDKTTVKVEFTDKDGVTKTRELSMAHPNALRAELEKHVGETVTVSYRESRFSETKTAELAVSEDIVDPWMGRIQFGIADLPPLGMKRELIQTSNPIEAIWFGTQRTFYFVAQVYVTMKRMIFSRSVGVENLSGPVGIVQIGAQHARMGFTHFLYLLAIISANLAVINFLPLPIVDGGLMVFLLIEKIKGSPVSIKIQMATQIVGLVLIAVAFLMITLQDISKF